MAQYGQISGNAVVNATIKYCLELIATEDAQKFLKKFREQPDDEPQIMHTFRELVLGAYLASHGVKVAYDRRINGDTPDWCILDSNKNVTAIIELVNFHAESAREKEMREQGRNGGVWVGWGSNNVRRLYDRISDKAGVYRKLVNKLEVPYVVGVFPLFDAFVDIGEVRECLFDGNTGLFKLNPEMSGVLFFESKSGLYEFSFIRNPEALRQIDLPNGEFRARPPDP